MTSPVSPPGWPGEVPSPEAADFTDRAVLWLLDEAPPEFRSHKIFRDYPVALAFAVEHYVGGALTASREAYADCRRTLAGTLTPPEVDAVLRALEFEGVRLVRLQREVGLVSAALAGRRWVERL